MTFSLDTIQKGIHKVPLRALIYGPNGIGKSHFAGEFPAPLFMDIEGNIDHLDVAKQRITTWQEAIDFLTFLQSTKHPYKTLVVDSLDQLQYLAHPIAMTLSNVKNMNEGYGKAWLHLITMFEEFRQECTVLSEAQGLHLIFISHNKIQRIHDLEQGDRDMLAPSLNDKIAFLFLDWCNLIGYAHRLVSLNKVNDLGWGKQQKVFTEKADDQIGSRVLRVIDRPSCIAKETFNLKHKDGNIPLSAKGLLTQIERFYNQAERT